jgi:DNA-binding transcriptional MerR regulator
MAEAKRERTYKIGDVCKLADVQPYVLRYWETEFPALAPSKSGGGQRAYTQQEVDIVLRIKQLLYTEGFTIAGAKKKLETEMNAPEPAASAPESAASTATTSADDSELRSKLRELRGELSGLLDILK